MARSGVHAGQRNWMRALLGCALGGLDERGLHSSDGIEAIACPDHPDRGSACSPSVTTQILAHRVDESTIGLAS